MENEKAKTILDEHLHSFAWDKNDATQKAMYLRAIDAVKYAPIGILRLILKTTNACRSC